MKTLQIVFSIACLWLALCGLSHAGDRHYYYTDPQGTPLAKADEQGNIIATYDYAPYGTQAMGTAPNGPGYTGHVNDPDTGFVYMQARYYDSSTGRFLSVDPVKPISGNIFNFSRYGYANNNPLTHIDPDGRMTGVWSDWRGDYTQDNYGDRHECNYCLSNATKNAWGSNEIPLGSGYVGRKDAVPGTDLYEIHVYSDTADFQKAVKAGAELRPYEVGVSGPTGEWINKHGHTNVPDLPAGARNSLRGVTAELARARNWLPQRGSANIRGYRLTSLIESGMRETGSLKYLSKIGRTLGPVAAGAGLLDNSVDIECSSGAAQAGGLTEELMCQ